MAKINPMEFSMDFSKISIKLSLKIENINTNKII